VSRERGFDVAIIGGGIIGASAAAYLAEAGRSVIVFERGDVASAASGRNSGSIQHPFDAPFAELHHDSLSLYRELADHDDGFELAAAPAGLLLVTFDQSSVDVAADSISSRTPELQPTALKPAEAASLEPALAPGLSACRLETGYPVAPASATRAFARRAERAGAVFATGTLTRPTVHADHVTGVRSAKGERVAADQVLVAAGPWTSSLVPGWSAAAPIKSTWGVVLQARLADAPRSIIEELGVHEPGREPKRLFSLITAGGVSSIGSTFLAGRPDPAKLAPDILARAKRFVPAAGGVAVESLRACARPVSFDGRPLIGAVPGVESLYVCAGHGPWGISTGPGSGNLIAAQMLGTGVERPEFSPLRLLSHRMNTEFA
jgi:glycine/D-amino acid oxidase-like deaminating enzyme